MRPMTTPWERTDGFGPNTMAVHAALRHAAGLLPSEERALADMMIRVWSWGRTDEGFPAFVAAIGETCHAAVKSGRIGQVHAARELVRLPTANAWDTAWPVAVVGVRITVAVLVVADLLEAEQRSLLLAPWRAATSTPSHGRGVA